MSERLMKVPPSTVLQAVEGAVERLEAMLKERQGKPGVYPMGRMMQVQALAQDIEELRELAAEIRRAQA